MGFDFKKIMEELAANQTQSIDIGDYYDEDGILCCGFCHTHKEFVMPKEHPAYALTGELRAPCACACKERSQTIKIQEDADRRSYERTLRMRREAFPEEAMQNMTFERDDSPGSEISMLCRKYAEAFVSNWRSGKGLIIYGGTGVGKTFYAMAIANKSVNACIPALVTSFPRLINEINAHFDDRQEYIDGLNRFPLLVIDDLGVENATDYSLSHMYSVVDGRYLAKLPMVITTNLTYGQMTGAADIRYKRIYERILERCYPVEYKGANRRAKIARSERPLWEMGA